jgi:hypothetical protein
MMIVVYAIGALVLGIVGGTLTLLAQGLCYLTPWDGVHWINLKVLAAAEAQSNWRVVGLVRGAAMIGRPYVAYMCPDPGPVVIDGSAEEGIPFIKHEVLVRRLSDQYETAMDAYRALELVCLELTDKSLDEIHGLVAQRMLVRPDEAPL